MNVSQASKIWLEYHRAHSKHNTVRAYQFTIEKFNQNFANLNLNKVSPDDILDFMSEFTKDRKPQTDKVDSFFPPDRLFQFHEHPFSAPGMITCLIPPFFEETD